MRHAAPPDLLARLDPGFALASFSELALAAGRTAVERGRISRPDLRHRGVEAVVAGEGRRSFRASLRLAGDAVRATCSYGAAWCGQAAALALLLAG